MIIVFMLISISNIWRVNEKDTHSVYDSLWKSLKANCCYVNQKEMLKHKNVPVFVCSLYLNIRSRYRKNCVLEVSWFQPTFYLSHKSHIVLIYETKYFETGLSVSRSIKDLCYLEICPGTEYSSQGPGWSCLFIHTFL